MNPPEGCSGPRKYHRTEINVILKKVVKGNQSLFVLINEAKKTTETFPNTFPKFPEFKFDLNPTKTRT